MVCHDRFIIFPPAAEGKGLCCLLTIHIKSHGKLCPKFRFNSKQLQNSCVGCCFIGSFFWQAAYNWITVHPMCLHSIGIAYFDMRLIKRNFRWHSYKSAQSPLLNQRVFFELLKLLFGQIFECAMVPTTALTKVGLLKSIIDGKCNRK